jgi:hypothetical protein
MITSAYQLKVIFLTPVLGSQPGDPELASAYIAKRKGLPELPGREDEFLEDSLDRGTTRFYRVSEDDDRPALVNYQVLGFLKEAGHVLNNRCKVKQLRAKVAAGVFISPRVIPLIGGDFDYLERPLRASGPHGPMVTLARSEMLSEGCWFQCGVEVLEGEITESVLRDLLDYGYYRGLGQWRGSGAYGTFRYELKAEQ